MNVTANMTSLSGIMDLSNKWKCFPKDSKTSVRIAPNKTEQEMTEILKQVIRKVIE